jgi:hypothetical protein
MTRAEELVTWPQDGRDNRVQFREAGQSDRRARAHKGALRRICESKWSYTSGSQFLLKGLLGREHWERGHSVRTARLLSSHEWEQLTHKWEPLVNSSEALP